MWLRQTLISKTNDLTEDDIYALISDPTYSDEDLLVGIDFLKTYLSRKPLVALFALVANEARSKSVRVAAADAISYICDPDTKEILSAALSNPELKI
jgi:hypothetical protein